MQWASGLGFIVIQKNKVEDHLRYIKEELQNPARARDVNYNPARWKIQPPDHMTNSSCLMHALHAYAWICMHMHAYACVCMHMRGYVCICMAMHGYACRCMHVHAYAWICMHMHAYACLCMHMHAYAYQCI